MSEECTGYGKQHYIDEMPALVKDLPFHRTSIEKLDVTITKPGTLFALTPTIRPKAASQEEALQKADFAKVDVPEVQLFPGEINRVSLYRKTVKPGERLQFKKLVHYPAARLHGEKIPLRPKLCGAKLTP